MPIAHGEGCYFADEPTLDALERDGQVLFRYVDADGTRPETGDRPIPTARCGRSPGVINARGNVAGLMPHPERASEAVLGSDDGLGDPPLARRERRRARRGGGASDGPRSRWRRDDARRGGRRAARGRAAPSRARR